MERLKEFNEYQQYLVNTNINPTKKGESVINKLVNKGNGVKGFENISNVSTSLGLSKRSVKNIFSRLLTKGIISPVNTNFNDEGVYFIKYLNTDYYKIGFSKSVGKRIKTLQSSQIPFNVIGVYCVPMYSIRGTFSMFARDVENEFKERFSKFNAKADISDKSEFYSFGIKDVNFAMKTLDELLLKWAMSYRKIQYRNNVERLVPVTSLQAEKAIKYSKTII